MLWPWGGGGLSSFTSCTSSSPSQSPPTIPAHTPSSSAPVYPTYPILAHSPAKYCLEATQTSEQTPHAPNPSNPKVRVRFMVMVTELVEPVLVL